MSRKHLTPTDGIASVLLPQLATLKSVLGILIERGQLDDEAKKVVTEAFSGVETFCAISLRIIAKTNPSKVRDEARTVEIQTLVKPF